MEDKHDIPQELFEAIERYVNGTMEPDELKDFNDYLKIDSEFKAQVEDIRTILLGKGNEPIQEKLQNSLKDSQQPKSNNDSFNKNPLINISRITLIIALIIALGGIWFFSISPNQKLYNKYFKPASELQVIDTKNTTFNDAMMDYNKGDYKTAIAKWNILNTEKPNNDTLNYYLGVAKMANKNVADAIPFLERSVSKNTFPLINDAYYYLGLAYLNEGNIELAKKYLSLSNVKNSAEILQQLTD